MFSLPTIFACETVLRSAVFTSPPWAVRVGTGLQTLPPAARPLKELDPECKAANRTIKHAGDDGSLLPAGLLEKDAAIDRNPGAESLPGRGPHCTLSNSVFGRPYLVSVGLSFLLLIVSSSWKSAFVV